MAKKNFMGYGDAETILTEYANGIKGLKNPQFTEAATRNNIASGESYTTIFGKIKKFFSDLKNVAFTGSYNDLSDKPLKFVDDMEGYLELETYEVEDGQGHVVDTGRYYTANVGTTTGTLCDGGDSRLSNARPASDVYAWAKAATKPTYTYSEVGACANNDSRLSNSRPASDVYAWAKASAKPSYSWSEITSKPQKFELVASFENTTVKEGYANISRNVTLDNYDVLFIVGGASDGQLRVYNAVPTAIAKNRYIQNNIYIDKRYYFNIQCTATTIKLQYICDPNYYLTRYIWVYGLKN